MNISRIQSASKLIEDSEKLFNQIISSYTFTNKELDELDVTVKEAYQQFQKLADEIQQNVKDSHKGCLSNTAKRLIKIHIATGIGVAATIASEWIITFEEDLKTKIVAATLGSFAGSLAWAADSYVTQIWFMGDDQTNMALSVKEGLDQGKILKKLIKLVKNIEQIKFERELAEKESVKIDIQEPTSLSPIPKSNNPVIDQKISNFLKKYGKLKQKNSEIYYKIIPVLIRKALPDSDPLNVDLNNLEQLDIANVEQHLTLPVNYMHNSNSQNQLQTIDWTGEETSFEKNKIKTLSKEEYEEIMLRVKQSIKERFNFAHELPYLDVSTEKRLITPSQILQNQ